MINNGIKYSHGLQAQRNWGLSYEGLKEEVINVGPNLLKPGLYFVWDHKLLTS